MGSVCSSAETPAVKFNPAPIDSLYELDDVVLGESGSTVVKRATRRTDGLTVAFKMLPRAEVMDEEADWTHFQMEVNVMQTLQHPGILKLYDVFEEKEQFHLVLEICEGGDMFDWLMRMGGSVPEFVAKTNMRQILEAVAFIHKMGFIHRDLKLENVLMVDEGCNSLLKIADFGFSKPSSALKTHQADAIAAPEGRLKRRDSVLGTPGYAAPELLQHNDYDIHIDIYALGCIMHALLGGGLPFDATEEQGGTKAIIEQTIAGELKFDSIMWQSVSKDAQEMISAMLHTDWKVRPSAETLLHNSWFHQEVLRI